MYKFKQGDYFHMTHDGGNCTPDMLKAVCELAGIDMYSDETSTSKCVRYSSKAVLVGTWEEHRGCRNKLNPVDVIKSYAPDWADSLKSNSSYFYWVGRDCYELLGSNHRVKSEGSFDKVIAKWGNEPEQVLAKGVITHEGSPIVWSPDGKPWDKLGDNDRLRKIEKMTQPKSTWWNYKTNEPRDFPPAGTECLVRYGDEWHKTFIVGLDDEGLCVYVSDEFDDDYPYSSESLLRNFKPLDADERAEEVRAVEWLNKANSSDINLSGTRSEILSGIYHALKSGELEIPK